MSEDWRCGPEFRRYWELQERVEAWQKRHTIALAAVHSAYRHFPPPPPPPPPPPSIAPRLSSFQLPLELFQQHSTFTEAEEEEEANCSEEAPWEEYEEEYVEEPAIEISTEMAEFFRKTRQHRMEREKEKKELNEKGLWFMPTTEDFVDPDTALQQTSSSYLPPKVMQSKEKIELAKEAYGDAGEEILGLEVLLSMKYEEELAKSKPNFWPNIPLKL